ncbi:MAG: 3-oxoacyl-ACP reductase [Candidatus Schekmanbacteria bacterium]|nr:3-oxoacyl-ACP reductase [Candidatus Schekmanbacteria bacterium]
MTDILMELGQNAFIQQAIKTLGLPIPIPQKLRRSDGPWEDRPLADRDVAVFAAPGGALSAVVAQTLAGMGAQPTVFNTAAESADLAELGEAFARPPVFQSLQSIPQGFRTDALVFDGTGLEDPAGLRTVYDFFSPLVRGLKPCGRIVLLGRSPEALKTAEKAAAAQGLEGFTRSVAREVGKRGATANVVYVDAGAEKRVEAVVRFLLSPRSAYITGQPFHVSKKVQDADTIPWTRVLDKKVALVTGAARGIGEAIAQSLAAEGAHVVCLDRPADDAPASRVARSVDGSLLLVDITEQEAPKVIAERLLEDFGGVDLVVHNAGITRDKTLQNMKPELWDQAVDVNLGAVTRITERLLDGVMRDGGRLVCLSSVAGIAGNFGQTNYSSAKSGIVGYVRALSAKVSRRGIAVNAIAPGFIETRLTAAIPAVQREIGRRMSALGQGGLPRDVADLATFLVSPGAQALTGQVIRICGGMFIGA